MKIYKLASIAIALLASSLSQAALLTIDDFNTEGTRLTSPVTAYGYSIVTSTDDMTFDCCRTTFGLDSDYSVPGVFGGVREAFMRYNVSISGGYGLTSLIYFVDGSLYAEVNNNMENGNGDFFHLSYASPTAEALGDNNVLTVNFNSFTTTDSSNTINMTVIAFAEDGSSVYQNIDVAENTSSVNVSLAGITSLKSIRFIFGAGPIITNETIAKQIVRIDNIAISYDPIIPPTSIIGSWYFNETPVLGYAAGGPIVMTFMANGQFVMGQDGDPASDPSGMDGMEWGTYNYDGATLTLNGVLDTNGEWGFSHGGTSIPVTIIGDVLTIDGGTPIPKVTTPSIIGGWQLDGPVDDESIVLTVIDGSNFMLVHGNNLADPTGQAGIEYGTYTWNEGTGAFAFAIATDTTGEFGLSHSTFDTLTLSGDTMTISTGGADPETLTRISGTALTISSPDATPDAFAFTDLMNVALDTVTTSEIVIITGIDTVAGISITGGEYSLNGGGFTSAAGIANNNDTLQLRTTSSVDNFTTTDVVVRVGTDGDTFSVTTLTDTIPDAFSFTDQSGVATGSAITSAGVAITGLGASSVISITGGEYSINGAGFTSNAGFINNNDIVSVRTTTFSDKPLTAVSTTLTIGGVSDTFTATTGTVDTTPNPFSFYDRNGAELSTLYNSTNSVQVSGINADVPISVTGGEYSIDGGAWTSASGTVSVLSRVLLRQTSSSDYTTAVNTQLTIGGVSATFSTTTRAIDTTPNQFSFYDRTDAQLNTLYNSTNSIQVSHIEIDVSISVTGGEYSIDGGVWTSEPGTVSNLSRVLLRQTSATTGSTRTDTVLTIGGVSSTFSVTTKVTDDTPNQFNFYDRTDAQLNTLYYSRNSIQVSGITATTPISVNFGEYSIDGGAWTSEPGVVSVFSRVQLRHTSHIRGSRTVNQVLTIGGVSSTFSTTTKVTDDTPNPFNFYDRTDTQLSTLYYSTNSIQVSGITATTSISVNGGEYSINGGAWTSATGTVYLFNRVRLRHTSAATHSATMNTALYIGGVSSTFSTTTVAIDTTPNPFNFNDRTDAQLNTLYNSTNDISVSGINVDAPISITDGEYSIDGGDWTSASGTVSEFSRVRLRQTSSSDYTTAVNTQLTIGGVSATFSTTTRAINTTPNQFSFYDRTGAQLNRVYNSTNSIKVSGVDGAVPISVTGGEYSIDGGAWVSAPGTVSNLSRVLLRQTSAGTLGTTRNAVLTIGGVSATFSITTKAIAADTTPSQFSYYDRTNAQLNRLFNSTNSIQVSGITADAPISVTGGEYSIDGGAWTSVPGTVSVLSRVLLRQTSASTNNTQTDTVLTIGGVSATFSITTRL